MNGLRRAATGYVLEWCHQELGWSCLLCEDREIAGLQREATHSGEEESLGLVDDAMTVL